MKQEGFCLSTAGHILILITYKPKIMTRQGENTITLEKALNAAGVILLSKHQIARCKRNNITHVWYSMWAGDGDPQLLNESGQTVFFFSKGKLKVNKY